MTVPFIDLTVRDERLKAELQTAVTEVVLSGQYILGTKVKSFEDALAAYCGTSHGIGVNSGTDALELALRAAGIGPGDEVIVPAFTFMATALAVTTVGATPVLVDIRVDDYGIDVADANRHVTDKTRAVIPVHLYGQPCDMEGVMALAQQHRLTVIEDCAQAIGAAYFNRKIGSFGHAGCFSFYPTKNLGAAGDGGAVVTSQEKIAKGVDLARNYGTADKVRYLTFGRNSRLDAIQAAVLGVKLAYLDAWNEARRERAAWYREAFARHGIEGVILPQELPNRSHVYHLFTIRLKGRDQVGDALKAKGIGTMTHYPRALHQDSMYDGRDLPCAEQVASEVLSLPMYPALSREAIETVVSELKVVLGSTVTSRGK